MLLLYISEDRKSTGKMGMGFETSSGTEEIEVG